MRRRRNTSAGTPHLFKKEGSNLDAIFIVGQHYAVADHLPAGLHAHDRALHRLVQLREAAQEPDGPFARDGGRYQRDALEHG